MRLQPDGVTVGLAIGEAPRETVNGQGSAPPPAPPPPTASDLGQPQQGGDERDSKSARKQWPDRAIYQPPAPAPRPAAEGEPSASGIYNPTSLFLSLVHV